MLRCALHIISGRIIYNSRLSRPAGRSKRIFTGGVWNELPQSKPAVLPAPSGREPLAWRYSFRLKCKACGRASSPLGERAQRLRGYKWRSEKSVKAIAPTGAALAFLCFDFFFRIVKGEQPLETGCGTQHPLRALGGTRVLLAAAPTTPPCFRRWRRSSSLLHINSGRIIYNFGVQESLRTFLNPIFTGGFSPQCFNLRYSAGATRCTAA